MAYEITPLTASKWTRSPEATLLNPANGVPAAVFKREEITQLSDGRSVTRPLNALRKDMTDPNVLFDVVDPTTGAFVRQASYGEFHALAYSLFLALQAESEVPQPPPEG